MFYKWAERDGAFHVNTESKRGEGHRVACPSRYTPVASEACNALVNPRGEKKERGKREKIVEERECARRCSSKQSGGIATCETSNTIRKAPPAREAITCTCTMKEKAVINRTTVVMQGR